MPSTNHCPDFTLPDSWFVTDYAACRADFLQATTGFEGLAQAREWSAEIPQQPELITDSVWLGAADARKVLVLISGTHGVEGYCGSAVQRFLLTQWSHDYLAALDGKAVLMIHALNPWGMENARRCDSQGIDLNRNFLDFNQPLLADADYPAVLNAISIPDPATRHAALAALQQRWGDRRFQQLLCGGQAECDWAPFFSGTAPARGNQIIDHIIAEYELAGRELVVLDLHSGLGPFSYGELISDHAFSSAGQRYALSLFGAAVANTEQDESFSVPLRGLQDYRWHELMPDQGCFLTLEFGSYPVEQLYGVLLGDHLQWHLQDEPALHTAQRQAMLEHFCPQDALWQQAVLFRSWQCVSRVMEHFANA